MKRSTLLCIFLIICSSSKNSLALSPPSQNELCKISGQVLEIGTEEGSDPLMNSIIIPVVKIKLTKVRKSEAKEKSFVDCSQLKIGMTHTFRNCGNYRFKIHSLVHGLVGRSQGGGRHCIDEVTGIKK